MSPYEHYAMSPTKIKLTAWKLNCTSNAGPPIETSESRAMQAGLLYNICVAFVICHIYYHRSTIILYPRHLGTQRFGALRIIFPHLHALPSRPPPHPHSLSLALSDTHTHIHKHAAHSLRRACTHACAHRRQNEGAAYTALSLP